MPLPLQSLAAPRAPRARARGLTLAACAALLATALGAAQSGTATAAAASAATAAPAASTAVDSGDCHVGAYALPEGSIVDIGRTDGGLRWRAIDGRTGKLTRDGDTWRGTYGWTERPDGVLVKFGRCGAGTIDFAGRGGRAIAFDSTETTFESHGTQLHGRLVLPPGRAARIGFQGPSQGGWVAPIAASRARVDFVIVSFGLAVSVLREDREAIEFQMKLKGHGPEVVARALEIGDAAARVFESGFTSGIEQFDAVRARHRDEPWYRDLRGNFTWLLLPMTPDQIRTEGAKFRWGTPFAYDPLPTLERLDVPQLWIVGGQDVDAPSGDTVRRLEGLIANGRPVTLAIYPSAEHGMTEFETTAEGERVSTRYAKGYFQLMADYARDGALPACYSSLLGDGVVASRSAHPPKESSVRE